MSGYLWKRSAKAGDLAPLYGAFCFFARLIIFVSLQVLGGDSTVQLQGGIDYDIQFRLPHKQRASLSSGISGEGDALYAYEI
jgi:hypothetical protein